MTKQNKTGFFQKFSNLYSNTNNFKKFIIVPIVILVVAFALLFTVGFNKSVDFTGGTAVRVFKQEGSTYQQVEQKVDKVLNQNGIKASVYQEVEFEGNFYLSVKYKNPKNLSEQRVDDLNNNIVNQLFTEFGWDESNLDHEDYVVGNQRFDSSVGKQSVVNAFVIIVLTSVLVVLYFVIRFKHHSAMTTLLAIYHDLLVTMGLTIIFRIPINLMFMAALLFVLGFSLLNNLLYFSVVKEGVKLMEKQDTAKKVATDSINKHFKTQFTLVVSALVALGVLMVFGTTSTFSVGMISIFGVFASFYSVTFLSPTLWSVVYHPHARKR